MNFAQAIKFCFKNYFNFKGRATRSEFWYFYLFGTLAVVVWCITLIMYVKILHNSMDESTYTWLYESIFPLVLIIIIPTYAAGARRFHDMNRSGWWQLIILIPIGIGPIVYYIWCCQKGTLGPNRFGPDPLEREFELEQN